eukprot:TRINITY_DN58055_c0_g1_i1.p1 TRINITY_DN58055_c0_g1~~TRINITY_DN58055_c0_g1_i1.p1  ORF type:complete len:484 (-),score=76.98 TRINITY_DN58055_c0_g1_i1:109-1560(-)
MPGKCGIRLLRTMILPAAWFCLVTSALAKYDPEARVESARLYGNLNDYAYYFTDLLVGSPKPQLTSVIVDTGSHLIGFPCSGCSHCGHHLEPALNIGQSQTAQWVPCNTNHHCDSCSKIGDLENGTCAYSEGYSEGSAISGHWFTDYVQLGDAVSQNPPVRGRMGCHSSENNLFYTQKANGIMGLAPSSVLQAGEAGEEPAFATHGQPTILDDLFRDKEHVDSRVFSICLADAGGMLTVGGYNTPNHLNSSSIQWARMRAAQYYFVFTKMLEVEDVMVAADPNEFGATIIDTGTTLTYFPGIVYDTLVSDLRAYCVGHAGCGAVQTDERCWKLNDENPDAKPDGFPTLFLHFSSYTEDEVEKVDWPASSFLNKRYDGLWCYTFHEHAESHTILGISWILNKDAIFDIANGRFGIAKAKCPEFRKVPRLWEVTRGLFPHLRGRFSNGHLSILAVFLSVGCAGVGLRAMRRRTFHPDLELEVVLE